MMSKVNIIQFKGQIHELRELCTFEAGNLTLYNYNYGKTSIKGHVMRNFFFFFLPSNTSK